LPQAWGLSMNNNRNRYIGSWLAAILLCVCKPKDKTAEPCDETLRLQVLARSISPVNKADDGESWPVHVALYQFSGPPELRELDPTVVYEQRQVAFKEHYVDKLEFTVYADSREKQELVLKPEVTDILAVAHFLRPAGDAWYIAYRVPIAHPKRVCEAHARGESLPPPCLYLQLQRDEVSGGAAAPPGFDPAAFETKCALVGAPSPGKQEPR